jgi:malonyl-CoA O-methyltransferase
MNKEIIIRDFSRCASTYDRYADVQRHSGIELLGLIERDGIRKILEIGCGTGNYTLLLTGKFRDAEFKAIDISGKMIEVAAKKLKNKNIEFITADAERFEPKGEFDLITSNACFQWFEDLEGALAKYKTMLRKDGAIFFSIFGSLTFRELNTALRDVVKDASTGIDGFIAKEKIETILKQNFREVKVKEARYEESFACLNDLLRKIKYSGIRRKGFGARTFFSRQLLSRLEASYLNRFKRIKATYQVFFCQGKKS